MSGSRAVRALILSLTGYACVRTAVIWLPLPMPSDMPSALADRSVAAVASVAATRAMATPAATMAMAGLAFKPATASSGRRAAPPRSSAPTHIAAVAVAPPPRSFPFPTDLPASEPPPPAAVSAAPVAPAPGTGTATPSTTPSRWSGYAYLFDRGTRGASAALAPAGGIGGQLGGSQAAARIAYRLGDAGHIAVAARFATALRPVRQAEAAVGVDLDPLPGLRLSVERRVALDRGGRDAFAAYAAGGLYRAVAPAVELDGYAQAGIVGVRARDPFVDAAFRLHRRAAVAPATVLRLGAGLWGAAQPGAARVDLGPRVAVTTRAARLPLTLAVEGRFRVAGRARPGDGVALTLATDF